MGPAGRGASARGARGPSPRYESGEMAFSPRGSPSPRNPQAPPRVPPRGTRRPGQRRARGRGQRARRPGSRVEGGTRPHLLPVQSLFFKFNQAVLQPHARPHTQEGVVRAGVRSRPHTTHIRFRDPTRHKSQDHGTCMQLRRSQFLQIIAGALKLALPRRCGYGSRGSSQI